MSDKPDVSDASRAAICHELRTLITLLEVTGEHRAAAHVGTALDIVYRPEKNVTPN